MNPTDPQALGIFVKLLAELQQALQPGMTLLRPVLLFMMGTMVLMECIAVATSIMLLNASVPASLLRLGLRTGVFLAVLLGAPALMTEVIDGFTRLGLLAGNNTINIARFMDPGAWLSMGFQTGQPLLDAWKATGVFAVLQGFVYLFVWAVLIIAFVYMGFSLFILQLQMTFCLIGGQVLLPFATSRFTSWMAQGAIAYPINMAYRFFFKAMISSVVFMVLRQRADTAQALAAVGNIAEQVQQLVIMCILPVAFGVLFWKSDSIAGGLLQGLPGLSTGHILQGLAGGAMLASGAGALAMGGAGIASRVGGAAVRAGAAMSTAYQLGSATSVGGRMAQLTGGAHGMLVAAGGAARQGLSSMASPSMQALRQNVQAGRVAGFLHTGGTLPASMQSSAGAVMMRPGPGFATQLRQTLQTSAYLLGRDDGHGGVHPRL
jgi:P-type conjugative transfer protein TrbL